MNGYIYAVETVFPCPPRGHMGAQTLIMQRGAYGSRMRAPCGQISILQSADLLVMYIARITLEDEEERAADALTSSDPLLRCEMY